jgi:hypothetical protein
MEYFYHLMIVLFFVGLAGVVLTNFYQWQHWLAKKIFLSRKNASLVRPAWAYHLIVLGSNFSVVTFLLSFILPNGFFTKFYVFGFQIAVYFWLQVGSLSVLLVGFFTHYVFEESFVKETNPWTKRRYNYYEIEGIDIFFSRIGKPHFELEIHLPERDILINLLGTDGKDFAKTLDILNVPLLAKIQMLSFPLPEEYQVLSEEEKRAISSYLPAIFPRNDQ